MTEVGLGHEKEGSMRSPRDERMLDIYVRQSREGAQRVRRAGERLTARAFSVVGIDPDSLPEDVDYSVSFSSQDTKRQVKATIGKPWGGGMLPVHVEETRADTFDVGRFIDADGGMWSYGDAFVPRVLGLTELRDMEEKLRTLEGSDFTVDINLATVNQTGEETAVA